MLNLLPNRALPSHIVRHGTPSGGAQKITNNPRIISAPRNNHLSNSLSPRTHDNQCSSCSRIADPEPLSHDSPHRLFFGFLQLFFRFFSFFFFFLFLPLFFLQLSSFICHRLLRFSSLRSQHWPTLCCLRPSQLYRYKLRPSTRTSPRPTHFHKKFLPPQRPPVLRSFLPLPSCVCASPYFYLRLHHLCCVSVRVCAPAPSYDYVHARTDASRAPPPTYPCPALELRPGEDAERLHQLGFLILLCPPARQRESYSLTC